MNAFRRNTGLPSAFRFRLRKQIARADLPDDQRRELLDAIYDDAFIDELGNHAIELYGDPKGGFLEWLKGINWLQVISIALSLLMLFLDSGASDANT